MNEVSGRQLLGGAAIVGVSDSASGTQAFRWTLSDGMVGLGDIAGGDFSSQAFAVSADGSIIVGEERTDDGQAAFIWDEIGGMRSLEAVLVDLGLDLTGWELTAATGISFDGFTIVGRGRNPEGRKEAWIATIPEPSTGALVGIGLLFLGIYRGSH